MGLFPRRHSTQQHSNFQGCVWSSEGHWCQGTGRGHVWCQNPGRALHMYTCTPTPAFSLIPLPRSVNGSPIPKGEKQIAIHQTSTAQPTPKPHIGTLTGWRMVPRMFWLWQLSKMIWTSLWSSRDSVKNLASAAKGSGVSLPSASLRKVGHWSRRMRSEGWEAKPKSEGQGPSPCSEHTQLSQGRPQTNPPSFMKTYWEKHTGKASRLLRKRKLKLFQGR